MNIAISGAPGTGKSSICRQLVQLGWTEADADETYCELPAGSQASIANRSVDLLARRAPASPTTRFVIDAPLGFAFGQPCLSCFIECEPAVAGQRAYEAARAEERYGSAEDATASLESRRNLEVARLETAYGISYADRDLFDLTIDTTSITPTEAALIIREAAQAVEADCLLGEIGPFRGEYRFLSNFYVVEGGIEYEGRTYSSSEAIYQALKTTDETMRDRISAMGPGDAKLFAHTIELRSDWKAVRKEAMMSALLAKFSQHDDLRGLLLSTQGYLLTEHNDWHDGLWGVCGCPDCRDKPAVNLLGRCLMETRRSLSR